MVFLGGLNHLGWPAPRSGPTRLWALNYPEQIGLGRKIRQTFKIGFSLRTLALPALGRVASLRETDLKMSIKHYSPKILTTPPVLS